MTFYLFLNWMYWIQISNSVLHFLKYDISIQDMNDYKWVIAMREQVQYVLDIPVVIYDMVIPVLLVIKNQWVFPP